MTKYFAQDTPQASLERMMMSVPGFQRRGGGISFSSFHYKPEDVDCQYCLHYRRKSCQIPICPYIAERLASGALEYHDLILECLGRNLRLRLYQRIRSVTHWDGPDQAILHKIRPYCQKEANRPQEDIPSVYWAALYLLASRESLWKTAVPALASGYIDFHCISCRGLAVRDYPIFYSAKRLYERKFPMDAGELASRSLIDDQDFLNALPEKEWHGGRVHEVRENILHLMRGQIFTFSGLTWFAMGGASSHDIQDGILDPEDPDFEQKYWLLRRMRGMFRVKGRSWWAEEMPNAREYVEALKNLEQVNWKVDCILSHCGPSGVVRKIDPSYGSDQLTDFLETVNQRCQFTYWFFGHYHDNRIINDRYILQWEQISGLEI